MSLTHDIDDSTTDTTFVEVPRALTEQLERVREEFDTGFVIAPHAEVKPTHQQLQHIREHLRDPSHDLSDPTERRYFRFIRRGGKWGAKMPRVEEVRLPFTTLIQDDYEFSIVDDGPEARVAILFTLTSRPHQRCGYRFVAPTDVNAPFAALFFKESLESGRLTEHHGTDDADAAPLVWLR